MRMIAVIRVFMACFLSVVLVATTVHALGAAVQADLKVLPGHARSGAGFRLLSPVGSRQCVEINARRPHGCGEDVKLFCGD